MEHHRRGGHHRPPRPRRQGRGRHGASRSSAWPAAPNRRRAAPPASPNWTACWAAGWCPPRRSWSAAIRASASPPCCCRPPPASRAPGGAVLYISGEESIEQIRLRARRLGVADAPLELAAAINLRDIAASLRIGRRRRPGGDRLDPDHVARLHRQRARHRRPGPRLQLRADPARQGRQIRPGAGRPRHQGRRHRRAPRAGAHGRCGAVFRRRPRPPVPHPARGEEPLRRHRRDRRVRDDRPRPGRGRQPLGAVPGRAAGQHRRQCGVRRTGGHPAGAGGGAGAAVAQSRRHAATFGDRLGRRAAADAARGAGDARRACG